jgi:hypothetical protein
LRSHVGIARREDNFIGLDFGSVGKEDPVGEDGVYLLAVLDRDFPVDDELGSANIDVVASTALVILGKKTAIVGAVVETEAGGGEAGEEVGVEVALE